MDLVPANTQNERPKFADIRISCSIDDLADSVFSRPCMKSTKKKTITAKVVEEEVTYKTVINDQDVQIMNFIGDRKLPTSDVATELDIALPNTHNKLSRMCAKGFVLDSYIKDDYRKGLHDGEKRRVWAVTAIGRDAIALHIKVTRARVKTGTPRKGSKRDTRPS